jgi:hypothetical protein
LEIYINESGYDSGEKTIPFSNLVALTEKLQSYFKNYYTGTGAASAMRLLNSSMLSREFFC